MKGNITGNSYITEWTHIKKCAETQAWLFNFAFSFTSLCRPHLKLFSKFNTLKLVFIPRKFKFQTIYGNTSSPKTSYRFCVKQMTKYIQVELRNEVRRLDGG